MATVGCCWRQQLEQPSSCQFTVDETDLCELSILSTPAPFDCMMLTIITAGHLPPHPIPSCPHPASILAADRFRTWSDPPFLDLTSPIWDASIKSGTVISWKQHQGGRRITRSPYSMLFLTFGGHDSLRVSFLHRKVRNGRFRGVSTGHRA
jgi:hypothetical protein